MATYALNQQPYAIGNFGYAAHSSNNVSGGTFHVSSLYSLVSTSSPLFIADVTSLTVNLYGDQWYLNFKYSDGVNAMSIPVTRLDFSDADHLVFTDDAYDYVVSDTAIDYAAAVAIAGDATIEPGPYHVGIAPTDIDAGTLTVAEFSVGGSTYGTVVGTVTTVDPDDNSGFTYAFASGGDAGGRFAIDAATGQITVLNGTLLDFEQATSHSVTIVVTDDDGNQFTKGATITVTNVTPENVTGDAASNTFIGGTGNDTLDGGAGADSMRGGVGNDVYVVDNAGDFVDEGVPGSTGTDKVMSSLVSVNLLDTVHFLGFIENVTLTGTRALNMTGNALGNELTGNDGKNLIVGGDGVDYINGAGGSDTAFYSEKTGNIAVTLNTNNWVWLTVNGLNEDGIKSVENIVAGSGSDTLNGDANNNIFKGNAGTDYLNGVSGTDTADFTDKTGNVAVSLNGNNWVWATVNGVNEDGLKSIENVWGGTGNDSLTGDASNNTFRGGVGIDVLVGGTGSDTADFSDRAGNLKVALNGSTAVWATLSNVNEDSLAGIENIIGTSQSDQIVGDGLDNILYGQGGFDLLAGGLGNDVLYGGANGDTFLFNTALNGTTNVDVLADFNHVDDVINLKLSVFAGVGPAGTTLAANSFAAGNFSSAQGALERIVYNTSTGELFYDSDGVGGVGAVRFAIVSGHPAVDNTDFFIV